MRTYRSMLIAVGLALLLVSFRCENVINAAIIIGIGAGCLSAGIDAMIDRLDKH